MGVEKLEVIKRGKEQVKNKKRRVWIYTCIDVPEDTHGALKQQYEQLRAYGEQLPAEIAGYSSDVGGSKSMERPGLKCFWREAGIREIEVLLVLDGSRLFRNEEERREFLKRTEARGIEVVSVLEGRLTGNKQPFNRELVHSIDHVIASSFGLEGILTQEGRHMEKEKDQEDADDSAGIRTMAGRNRKQPVSMGGG